ncbi:MAG: hypothetical protein FJZ88_03215, partial [Chloroflexi bacterium]|nr:hypothetical protein [Chloroflexota bacterium]
MKTWQIVLLCIVGVVVLLLGTVVVKTVTFTSKQLQFEGKVTSQVDVNAAAERLAKALQFKTI